MLVFAVAIPASRCQPVRGVADQDTRVPVGDAVQQFGREVGATVDDPADALGVWGRRKDAGAQGRVGAGATQDVPHGRLGRWELDLVWDMLSSGGGRAAAGQVGVPMMNMPRVQKS